MPSQEVKPYRIVIEWTNSEDFLFSCDYKGFREKSETPDPQAPVCHRFPHVTKAMGNVLKKLRREHITFPLFLLSLAFEHRGLLNEIDDLLRAIHTHLENQNGSGSYRCHISGNSSKTVSNN